MGEACETKHAWYRGGQASRNQEDPTCEGGNPVRLQATGGCQSLSRISFREDCRPLWYPRPWFQGYQGTSRDINVDGPYRMEGVSIMPIYEYRCLECSAVFSHLVLTFTDASGERPCPVCGGEQARRLMSTFTVGGRVDPGPGRTAWPTSWNDTNGGDRKHCATGVSVSSEKRS